VMPRPILYVVDAQSLAHRNGHRLSNTKKRGEAAPPNALAPSV
jgi:hypothetical protein